MLEQTLAEREQLLQEVHLRVNNNLQLMVSLIHISATYTRNAKEFGLAVTGQIEVMAAVSQLLTRAEAREFVNCVE